MSKKHKKYIKHLEKRVHDLEITIGYEQSRINQLEAIVGNLTNSDPTGYA